MLRLTGINSLLPDTASYVYSGTLRSIKKALRLAADDASALRAYTKPLPATTPQKEATP
jgi:hypothetical protein